MKHLIQLILLIWLIFGAFQGFCQKGYEPFVNDTKVWRHVETLYVTGESGMAAYLVKSSYFGGDTLVNDTTYRILYSKAEQPTSEAEQISFFIYEDTVNQKVYGYDPFYDKSVLLYDFQLKEGDPFKMYIFGNIDFTYTVQKVDTITSFNNKQLKRIVFDESLIWIEGIGNVYRHNNPFNGDLICVTENKELLYMDEKYDNCDTIFVQDGWGEVQSVRNSGVMIYPNPVKSNSVLMVNNHQNEKLQIEIYSITGALIKEDNFRNIYPIGSLNLNNGLYLYRISSNKRSIHADKIVIQY